MVFSELTDQVRISDQSSPRNSTIDTFLIHHQAGINDDAVIAAMVSGSRGVSANYTISNEGRITCVVPEDRRAWTSGSSYDGGKGAAWDHRAVTVEIENQSAGGSWPISAKALDAAARLLTDLRSRYSIKHVLGHRDLWNTYRASYATFCPGPETVAKIVTLAGNQISTAGGGSTPIVDTPKRRKKSMSTLFYDLGTTENGKVVDGKTMFALGGDSPGTDANWQATTVYAHAEDLAATHGSAVPLSSGTFANRRAAYLSPVKTSGSAAVSIDYTKLAEALAKAIPPAAGSSVDLAPVLTVISALPTADAIATATRNVFTTKPLI